LQQLVYDGFDQKKYFQSKFCTNFVIIHLGLDQARIRTVFGNRLDPDPDSVNTARYPDFMTQLKPREEEMRKVSDSFLFVL
jgi:hypothetical protein